MLQKLASQVLELYHTADESVSLFRQTSGLACPDGCVTCCFSAKVEATVAEMLPAAFHLFATSQAELLIKRLEREETSQCLLFRPDLASVDGGGCSLYPFRALVCRLFGYAGNHDRNGTPQLAKCRHMEPPGNTPAPAGTTPLPGATMPIFHAFGVAVSAIHPGLGTRRMPINLALLEALTKVGLYIDFSTPEPVQPIDRDEPPDSPATSPPLRPRKAA